MQVPDELKLYYPTPHPTKQFFIGKGIPLAAVARYCKLSYSHTVDILNGVRRCTNGNDKKIRELAKRLGWSER